MKTTRHHATRFVYVPEIVSANIGSCIALSEAKVNHLSKVLRLQEGTVVFVTDGLGSLFEGTLLRISGCLSIQVKARLRSESKPNEINLVLCLPKNNTADEIVEKAQELGVAKIIPVESSRSIIRIQSSDVAKYLKRWEAIAEHSLEQSEGVWKTKINPPISWNQWLDRCPKSTNTPQRIAFVSEIRHNKPEEHSLKELRSLLSANPKSSTELVIGPEGGFTQTELENLECAGYALACLGHTVLRVETAAIVAITITHYGKLWNASV